MRTFRSVVIGRKELSNPGFPGAFQVREFLARPGHHDLFLVAEFLEARVADEVLAHVLEVRGPGAVHLHRDLLFALTQHLQRSVAGERVVDVCLLAGRERPADGVDVAVLNEFVQCGERGVVEGSVVDFEPVGVLDLFAELVELPIPLAGDPIGFGIADVDLLELVVGGVRLVGFEQAVLACHLSFARRSSGKRMRSVVAADRRGPRYRIWPSSRNWSASCFS